MSNPRVVIITGAAGGVGRAMLAEFAGRGDLLIGVDVAQSGLTEAVREFGDQHHAFECDLSDEANIMETLEIRILEKLGVQNPYTETIPLS